MLQDWGERDKESRAAMEAYHEGRTYHFPVRRCDVIAMIGGAIVTLAQGWFLLEQWF